MSKYPGVPDNITIDFVREWMRPRVSERRYKHVEGVASVGAELARHAQEDVFLAELGGWLHDACKEHKEKQLVEEARAFGLELHPIEVAHGHILHGPVGACVARAELGITNQELLNAVAEHTLGAINMTPLSQILFLADCLEESRDTDFTVPIWKAMGYKIDDDNDVKKRKLKHDLDMDAGILVACDLSLAYLLEDKKVIHPKTVDVRNWYLDRIKAKAASAK